MRNRTIYLLSAVLLAHLILSVDIFAQASNKTVPRVASYWKNLKGKIVQCLLCPRKCVIPEKNRGFCGVRTNKDGLLYTLGYGNPLALHVDPIEKKPFFHVLPGSSAYSLAVAGCNMRCVFCQNWQISQARPDETINYSMTSEDVVKAARESNCKIITFTYTEPTVFFEYMLDIAKAAKREGLLTSMHTCGYINPEPLAELLKVMDFVNVDLKGFSDEFYNKMGSMAELAPVLETVKGIKKAGVWLEITTLLIPGVNDDAESIAKMCRWIKDNLGADVPVHMSRFYPNYKLQNLPPTSVESLRRAYAIAKDAGLNYVYIGNMPGDPAENTVCPKCGKVVVARKGYSILENNIVSGNCKFCGYKIAGIWTIER